MAQGTTITQAALMEEKTDFNITLSVSFHRAAIAEHHQLGGSKQYPFFCVTAPRLEV